MGERTKVRGFVKQSSESPQGFASIPLILSFSPGGEKGLASKLQWALNDKIFGHIPYRFLSPLGERTKVRGLKMNLKNLAKGLRKNQTDAERKLWSALRNRQLKNSKFRRQYWIKPYIADFVCLEKSLIVELDGSQHFENIEKDNERTTFLEKHGFHVLRFRNNEVLNEFNAVLERIYEYL
jgi:very-short-patch-repair endonuclease